jgi:predicted MFS family arabinose efflux permease
MRTITASVRPAGALLGGLLGTWLGVRSTLWITAACALAAGLLLLRTTATDAEGATAEPVASGHRQG